MTRTICFPLLGRTVGGSHHSTLLLASRLDPARYRPLIVTHEEGPLAAIIAQYGLGAKSLKLPFMPRSAKDLLFPRWQSWSEAIHCVSGWLAQEKPDAVHLDDGPLRYLWQPAARRNDVPYVHYQRTPARPYDPEKMWRYAQCDLVLCNSAYTLASMPLTVKGRTQVVHPPIDLGAKPSREQAREALLQKHGLSPDTVIAGFLANLQARKRPQIIPEIAERLKAQGKTNIVFLMAGAHYDAQAERTVQRITELGLEKTVLMAGFTQSPIDFLAGCDILLAPAVNEAFGRTLIEAMFAGTLVIASDAGGHREIIRSGKNGILVPADDIAAFTNCIAASLQSREAWQEMVAQGEIDALQYDVVPHVKRVMDLYDGIFTGKNAHAA